MWCCRSAAAHRRCLCLLLHHVVSTARLFYAAAQLEGESGQRLTALFNNDIGPSLFLKADVRRRNCTWATCGGGSARTGAACAGASATVCVQDNDGIYRSGWLHVSRRLHIPHVTRHTSHVTRHTSHVTRHTSHVTRHTSHVTRHTSHVTRHTSHVTRHTPHVTRHTSRVTV